MERFCFTFEIHPGTEAEYQRLHDEMPPEIIAGMRAAGIGSYALFRRGTTIIAYAECEPDAARAFAKLRETDAREGWGRAFDEIIVSLTGPDGDLVAYTEVWHL
jgi:L-rhamnose mutarotase